MVERIYIIGYMGAGKSGIAKYLARHLGWQSCDTDVLFEQKYHITIFDFFEKYGQDVFRKLEREILLTTTQMSNVVVSTGGGTPCFFDNMDIMNQCGITIFLDISAKSAAMRLSQSKKRRPLIKGLYGDELKSFVEQQYAERMHFYNQAQMNYKAEDCDVARISQDLSITLNKVI